MSSNTYISSDFLERRGSETRGNIYKGDNTKYGSVDIPNILLGENRLSKSSISSFNYNYVYQYFIERGTDEVTAKSMTLIINDIAKLKEVSVQEVLHELEREYTIKLDNPVVRAKAIAIIEDETITEIKIIDNGLSFYDVSPSINIIGDGIGAIATLTLNQDGTLTPTIVNGGAQYTDAIVEIDKVQLIKNNTIYIPSHEFITGDSVYFTPNVTNETSSSLPFGLQQYGSDGKPVIYYVIVENNNYIKLAETEKDVRLGREIDISTAPLDGGFIINRTFNFNVNIDSFIYMNSLRPVTKQMMSVTPAKASDTLRHNRLLP